MSDTPESLQCFLDCCEDKASWCGLCMSHCNGDEDHNVVPSHWDQNCECEWSVTWILAGNRLIKLWGGEEEKASLADHNPDKIIFWAADDIADDLPLVSGESMIQVYAISVGDATRSGANPGALINKENNDNTRTGPEASGPA